MFGVLVLFLVCSGVGLAAFWVIAVGTFCFWCLKCDIWVGIRRNFGWGW